MKISNRILPIPIIQGGMGIGVSLGRLAGSVAKEGAMGVISTANTGFREPDFWTNTDESNLRGLKKEIAKAKDISLGNGILAINAMAPTKNYDQTVRTAIESGIDAVISGAGLPLGLPALAEGFDVLLAPIVSSGRAASLICRTWIKRHNRLPDFVVLEGSGAGGHLGFSKEALLNKTTKSLDELFIEVRNALSEYGEIPIFVAGSIFTGQEVANWINKGASGVQIATRFIATHECDAADEFKQAMINATSDDACIVKSPVGMPGRALHSPLIIKVENGEKLPHRPCIKCINTCSPATTPYCITNALIDGVLGKWETGLFFCGENVGRINKLVSVKELLNELTADWRK